MMWPAFPSISLSAEQLDPLFAHLSADRLIRGPQKGADGLVRLQPLPAVPRQTSAQRSFLPLKKLLFPDGDPLWDLTANGYADPVSPPALLLVDIPLCDLQALAWLDRCFAEDELYRRRRTAVLVVGAPCVPVADCACQPDGLPPGGDLFRDGRRLWALSPSGAAILQGLAGTRVVETVPLAGPDIDTLMPSISEALFAANAGAPLWDEAAARCLACGACSAVCPTCACYEVLDEARLDGSVTRRRVWDNCFFPDHARVAGGYDFRAGRGARLRFRFEHKRLGFGALRGMASCVGCGRCRRACPVGIDLETVARRLVGDLGS
jgi:ferredoxin